MQQKDNNHNSSKISIIMGVYNCMTTLREAVSSIVDQTYDNWELIICNDGSTDATLQIACELSDQDKRIIVFSNPVNSGLNVSLNRCLRLAKGQFIARMDGDDISAPDRLEKQIMFLKEHPEVDLVSSWMTLFDENGDWGIHKTPAVPTVREVVLGNPICHAPVMIRQECLRAVGGYSESSYALRVEDVDLWIRLFAKGYRCKNIQEPLYKMRNDQQALSRRKYIYRVHSTLVRLKGCRLLHLDAGAYMKSFMPMLYGLIPGSVRKKIRRYQNRKSTPQILEH